MSSNRRPDSTSDDQMPRHHPTASEIKQGVINLIEDYIRREDARPGYKGSPLLSRSSTVLMRLRDELIEKWARERLVDS